MSELVDGSLARASTAVESGETSVLALVLATLERIRATEPILHAYASVREELALRDAIELDLELEQGKWRGPLHGVPIAVKDLFYTVDAPTRAGSAVLEDFVAPYDATGVARLRRDGAVMVGKTVLNEFGYAHDELPTRNPWDPAFLPGGSSAGSAAAVAAGSAAGALGTDTGGSVRIPAAMTGVVGLKPTFGLISRRGVVPLSWSLDHVGILARTVEDCALMLRSVAGHDADDPSSLRTDVPDYREGLGRATCEGVRLGLVTEYFLYEGVSAGVRRAFDVAVEVLEELGATVVEVSLPELDYMTNVGWTLILAEASSWHRHLLREKALKYSNGTRFTLELGELLSAQQYLTAQRARRLVRDAVRDLFRAESLDALIGPTSPLTATRADAGPVGPSGAEEPNMDPEVHHCIPANVTGQPAISVPCGFDEQGLPVGLQIIGRPLDEVELLRIARAYEAAQPWWRRRPMRGSKVT